MFNRTRALRPNIRPQAPISWCVASLEHSRACKQRPRLHSRRSSGLERCSGKEPGQVKSLWLGIRRESPLVVPGLRISQLTSYTKNSFCNPIIHQLRDRSKLLSRDPQACMQGAAHPSQNPARICRSRNRTHSTKTQEHNPAASELFLRNRFNAPLNGHNVAASDPTDARIDVLDGRLTQMNCCRHILSPIRAVLGTRGWAEEKPHLAALSTPPTELPELSRSYESSALTCSQPISEAEA